MRINSERDLCILMAKAFGYIHGGNTHFDQHACMGMPEVVDPDLREAGLPVYLFEFAQEPIFLIIEYPFFIIDHKAVYIRKKFLVELFVDSDIADTFFLSLASGTFPPHRPPRKFCLCESEPHLWKYPQVSRPEALLPLLHCRKEC